MREIVQRLGHRSVLDPSTARRPSRSKDSAPCLELGPLDHARPRPACESGLEHILDPLGLDHRARRRRRARGRRPGGSSRRRRSPARRSSPRCPCRRRRPAPSGPRSAARSRQLLADRVTAASTSTPRRRADLGLRGEQVADQRHRPRLGHRQHEHLARLESRHRGVDHQVVVLAAADRPRRAGGARARHDLERGRRRRNRAAHRPRTPSPSPSRASSSYAEVIVRHHLWDHALERLGLPDRRVRPRRAGRGCRGGRRAGRSRSGGSAGLSSPPSRRACARSPP